MSRDIQGDLVAPSWHVRGAYDYCDFEVDDASKDAEELRWIQRSTKLSGKSMIKRILNSRNFVASLPAATTGMALYLKLPFPSDNVFLRIVAVRAPLVHRGLF